MPACHRAHRFGQLLDRHLFQQIPRRARAHRREEIIVEYLHADYPTQANDTIVSFAMIETRQALDNLDDILSVEGLDAVYIGPSDLSLSLGCTPTFDALDPKAAEAVDHILARAKAHGVVAGIHNGSPEAALKRIAEGFQFVTVSSDARLMAAGAQQVIAKMRARPSAPQAPAASGSY